MSLTIVVTRDVEQRYRGFLGSTMLEVAAGVYVSPRLNRDTRERIWAVAEQWWGALRRGAVVMMWRDRDAVGGLGLRVLGEPPKDLVDVDGLLLTRRKLRDNPTVSFGIYGQSAAAE